MKIDIVSSLFLVNATSARIAGSSNTNNKDQDRSMQTVACFASSNLKFTVENGECSASEVIEGIQAKIDNKNNCNHDAETEIELLTGGNGAALLANVTAQCEEISAENIANQRYLQGSMKGDMRNERKIEEFFDGGTNLNEERQYTDEEGVERWVLQDDFSKINSFYENAALGDLIEYPNNMKNFEDCEVRAAYCCWIQDRQAGDNNGNCATPYDDNCVNADPGDNTDLCYVDMTDGSASSHIAGGFSIFPDDEEGDIHCHGFAWGNDEDALDVRYKGNNLFYVSMYDHFYQRGYVRGVPGAPMCGCAEQMPVVSRADCTEMDISEKFRYIFDHASQKFRVVDKGVTIEYNACQGANDNNNDLEAYYERLVDEDRATATELETLQEKLVGDCDPAIEDFVASKLA